jgi:probable HAF family extracellular repeat protein
MRLCDPRLPDFPGLRRAGFAMLAALWMSLSAASGARAAAISFAPPVTYDVPGGGGPLLVDLDGDGKLDLVVSGSQALSVFYGKGDGTLEPRVDVTTTSGWVTAADVNGDGLLDLITTQGDAVVVMINQGNRHFAAPVSYPVGHLPAGITAGDFNGDGLPDLAVSNHGSNNMCVLLNQGDGTFAPAVFYPGGDHPARIACADYNGDGNLDLAMSNYVSGDVIVYLGDGKGGFTVSGSFGAGGMYPAMILTDDFNGDGIPDLATANTFGNSISIFLGDGTGKFSGPAVYPTVQYPHIFASADLNDDGVPDIVAPNNGTGLFTLLQNKGDGTFLPAVTFNSGGSDTRLLAVGDLNGDGLPDVVTGNGGSNNVSVLINTTPLPTPAIRSLTLDTTSPVGGYQVINGTVTLTAPAPAGGAVVALSTNNAAVNVPPTVTIPEGQTTAGIVLGTTPVAAPQRGNVSASFNGTAKRIAVTVRAPAARFALQTPGPVTGGQPETGKVTSEVPAGPNGLVVTLSSGNPGVLNVPATVTIPAGQSSVSFPFTTTPVSVPTTVFVTVSIPGAVTTIAVKVGDLGVPLPVVNGTGTPPIYNLANGHWYQAVMVPGGINWPAARDAAAALSYAGYPGHLATITSAAENQFLINNLPIAQDDHWRVGGYQDHNVPDYSEPAGGWRWVTGQPWSFTNWRSGEPNNANGGEDFLEMHADGTWNDCSDTWLGGGYLVEYEPSSSNLLVNGSFEAPAVPAGQPNLTLPGGGDLTGWQIKAGTVDVVPDLPSGWPPAPGQGNQSLDLVGNPGAGTIEQSFATEPGRLYIFSGWISHAWGIDEGRVNVSLDGVPFAQIYHSNSLYGKVTPTDLRWQPFLYAFRATGASTTLTLTDITGLSDVGGAVLDGLVVAPAAPLPPAAPTTLAATAVSPTQVNLSWTDPPAPRVPGGVETSVEIQRKSTGDWAQIAQPSSSSSSYADSSLGGGTHFTYRVRAVGPGGPSAWSNEASVDVPTVAGVSLDATSHDFGTMTVGSQGAAQTITLTNNGNAPLTLGSLALSGPNAGDFTVTTSATTIAPGDKATLSITFSPAAPGLCKALLTINSNAPGTAATISLTGSALMPLTKYVLVDLGTDLGTPIQYNADLYSGHFRLSINTAGVVAGSIPMPNGGSHAAISDVNGTHDLGTLSDGSTLAIATGINAAGQITGLSGDPNGNQSHAFIDSGGVMKALNTPGTSYVAGHAINDIGDVVGLAVGPGLSGAFLYDSTGLHDLGTLGGGSSDAFAINRAGQVVGWASTTNDGQHAFLYDGAGMHDLGTLPGSHWSSALAINDAGQVVGQSYINSHGFRAFLYDSAGMHDLGTWGLAYGINGLGQIVGEADDTAQHAFLYTGGAMTDLNSLLPANSGWVLTEAHAINDAGQIVGLGTLNGQKHAFLLTFPSDPRATPPRAPAGLSVTTASTSELDLAWTDNSSNEFGFEVQRKAAGGDWTTIGTRAANTATFSDTGLAGYAHYTYRVRAVNGTGASDWSNEAGGDTGTRGQMSLSVSGSLNFGNQVVGTPSAAQTVTITNSGNGPLTVGSVTITGNNANEFAPVPKVTTPMTLAPGETGSLSLVFTPAGIGACSATLTIASDAPAQGAPGPATLALTGSGVGPVVRLSPTTSLDFGQQPEGLGTPLSLLIQNSGNAPLHVGSISFQGANAGDFSLASDGVTGHTLQPGDISLLNVRFTPGMTGTRGGTMVITDDAPDSPQSISLMGFGTAPLLRLSADSLIFNLQAGNTTQTLTLTNNGDATLNIDGLTLTGPDAGSFKIVSDTGENSLPVGGSRTVQIAFQSATVARARRHWSGRHRMGQAHIAAASYNAALEIKDNDPHPGSPHTVALIAGSAVLAGGDSTPPPLPPGFGAPRPPAAPSGLSAHVVSPGEIDLAWTRGSGDETAVAIFRQSGSGPWQRIAEVKPGVTSFADRSLQPGTSYSYRVRTHDNSQVSAWSNEAQASTPPLLPASPSGLTAIVMSPGEIDLAWTKGNGDETGVAIFRQSGSRAWQRIAELKPNATAYIDRSAQPGVSYSYRVRTHDNTTVSAWSNEVPASTPLLLPATVTNLTATVVTATEIDLAWTAGGSGATGVAIWRQAGSGPWRRIGVVKPEVTHYADRSAQPGTSYRYRVRAHSSTGVSDWTNAASGITPASP